MSKRDAAPTLGWVVSSHLWKWLTIIILLMLAVFILYWYRVFAIVTYDCSQPYDQTFKFGSKHVAIHVTNAKIGCAE